MNQQYFICSTRFALCQHARFAKQRMKATVSSLAIGFALGVIFANFFYRGRFELSRSADGVENERENVGPGKESDSNSPKILCWILTGPKNHYTRAQHVVRTWGRRCDKLLLMSSQADEKLGTIALPVVEGYKYLWPKTREALKYIYKHHLSDGFDWVMKADDDTYVVLENLRHFLRDKDPKQFHYFGIHIVQNWDYNGGGPGYVMSLPTLRHLVEVGFSDRANCILGDEGGEDSLVGICLGELGIFAGETKDELGRLRFIPDLRLHVLPEKDANIRNPRYAWRAKNTHPGIEFLAKDPVSFHKILPEDMYTLEYLLYHVQVQSVTLD